MSPEELQQAIENFKSAMEVLPAAMQNSVDKLNQTAELLNKTNENLRKTAGQQGRPSGQAKTQATNEREVREFKRSADTLEKVYEELKKAKDKKQEKLELSPEAIKALKLSQKQERSLKIEDRNPLMNVKVEVGKLEKLLKEMEQSKKYNIENFGYMTQKFDNFGSAIQAKTQMMMENNKENGLLIGSTIAVNAGFKGASEALTGYVKSIMDGKRGASVSAKAVSDFTKSVTDAATGISLAMMFLPGVGWAIKGASLAIAGLAKAAKLAADVNEMGAKQVDSLFGAFNELGKASATGTKGVMGVFQNLQDLGYSTGEVAKYQQLVVSNSKDLAMFGPTVSQGADKFVLVAKEISGAGKDLGKKFQALGITSEEQNEHILKYMSLQARQGTLQGKSTEDLRKGAAAYIEELDAMARLTGLSRKELEESREVMMADNQLRAAIVEAESRGDTQKAEELKRSGEVAGVLAKMGLTGEATSFMKQAATGGALPTAGAGKLASLGINAANLQGLSKEEQLKAIGEQLGRSQKTYAASERLGDSGMFESGFAKVSDAVQRLKAGKFDVEAGKKEQKQIMEQPDAVTKSMIEANDAQRQLALRIDKMLGKTFLDAVNIHETSSKALLEASKKFEQGLEYLKFMKKIGIDGPGDFALKGGTIALIASAVMAHFGFKKSKEYMAAKSGSSADEIATKVAEKLGGGRTAPGPSGRARSGGASRRTVPSSGPGGFARRAGRGARTGGGMASRSGEGASSLIESITEKGGPGLGDKMADFGKGLGGIIKGVGEGGGALIEAVLTGIARGISEFANPLFLVGAVKLGLGIIAIGAAVAGATWLMGKALPTLAEGLKGFSEIDGSNLIDVGLGVTALGVGLATFAAGGAAASFAGAASGIVDGLVGFFGGKTPFDKIKEFSKLDIDGKKLKENAEGVKAFGEALAAVSGASASVTGAISDSIAGFFGGKPPLEKFVEFSKLPIDNPGKVKSNAEALREFAVALAALGGGAAISGLGAIGSSLGDGLAKLFGVQNPWEKFVEFSKLPITGTQVKTNAEALRDFALALAALGGGAGISGLGAIGSAIGDGLAKLFGVQNPWEKFLEFSKLPITGTQVKTNAEALKLFIEAIGSTKISTGVGKLFDSIGEALGAFTKTDILSRFAKFVSTPLKDPEEARTKSEALKFFVEALAGSNLSAGQGLAKLGESYAGLLDKIFRNKTPIERFEEFAKLKINPGDVKKNAEAFREFTQAMGMWGTAGGGGGTAGAATGAATQAGTAATAGAGATAGGTAGTGTYSTGPISQDVQGNLESIKAALQKKGLGNENYINAVLGTVMKESGGKMVQENMDYSKTSNERIRSIFGSRVSGMSEEELNKVKSGGAESFSNAMYGGEWGKKHLGNTEPGDGWKYRGRGFIGLTGKTNYAAASKAIYGDDRLVQDPDLVNRPEVASEIVAWFMQKNQPRMAQLTGVDPQKASLEDAVKLAVSTVAGRKVEKGQGFIGTEGIGKAQAYASKFASGGTGSVASQSTSSAGPTTVASGSSAQTQSQPESHAVGSGSPSDSKPKLTSVSTKSGKTAMVNTEYAPRFQSLLDYLDSVGYNIYSLGGYADRDVTNRPGVKSIHAHGAAIDINPKTNPYGSTLVTDMPEGIQQVAAKLGLGWGGAWDTPKDAMHFSAAAREGGTVKLSDGGIAIGPRSGYPAELHGTEMILPIHEKSVLRKLATTSLDSAGLESIPMTLQKAFGMPDTNSLGQGSPMTDMSSKMNELISSIKNASTTNTGGMSGELANMLIQRMDSMVDLLERSNRVQESQLKHMR